MDPVDAKIEAELLSGTGWQSWLMTKLEIVNTNYNYKFYDKIVDPNVATLVPGLKETSPMVTVVQKQKDQIWMRTVKVRLKFVWLCYILTFSKSGNLSF